MNGAGLLPGAGCCPTTPFRRAAAAWSRRRLRPEGVASIVFSALTVVEDEPGFQRIAFDIELDEAPAALCNRAQIQQVTAILLRSAIAAAGTQTFPKVTIRIHSLVLLKEPGASFVEVVIRDNGGGISLEERASLFETDCAGRGPGLTLARQIIESQGGAIACELEDWGRSSIRFSLPRAAA